LLRKLQKRPKIDTAEEHFSSLIGQLLDGDIVPEAILFHGLTTTS
jgi:hypothetical protein